MPHGLHKEGITLKAGRKTAYSEKIEPRLSEIEAMARKGANDKEIIKMLGISGETFYKYLREKAEFADIIKKARQTLSEQDTPLVYEAMKKKALGYRYTEKKKIIERDEYGQAHIVRVEEYEKEMPPDTGAGIFLLKNLDKERGWANEPASVELRKEELEIRRMLAEKDNW